MSSMMAEQVQQLVKDFPKDAQPCGIKIKYNAGDVYFVDDADNPMSNAVVYWACVGSGLAWLAEKGDRFHRVRMIDYWNNGTWSINGKYDDASPTLLHAVSAAVLSAAKTGT